jgi:hypothetical protein
VHGALLDKIVRVHVVQVVVVVVVREDKLRPGLAQGLDEAHPQLRCVVEKLVLLPEVDVRPPGGACQGAHLPVPDGRCLFPADSRILNKAFAAVRERDEKQGIAALPALKHGAQAEHLVILMGHDRNYIHRLPLFCSLSLSGDPVTQPAPSYL